MSEQQEWLEKFSKDRALAASIIFPHRHPQESPPAHVELWDVLCCGDEFIQIEGFREFAKTTIAEEFIILGSCFRNWNYGLIIGETYEKAVQRLAAIDYECRTNETLLRLFGGSVLARKSIENKMWFASGVHLQIFGWEQELQSFKYLTHRPDLAFLDDVENEERTRDKAAVDASMEKLFRDLMPAMDTVRSKIINSQTRRAEDCMVTRLASNDRWLYRGYPICDRDCDDPEAVATWPQRYPMERIREMKKSYMQAGMLSAFLQSYMLQTTNPESRPFKPEKIAEMQASPWHWMPRYVIYDPSRTSRERKTKDEGEKSDRCGKVVVSKLGSQILVHESAGEYWKPDAFLEDVFLTNEKHNPAKIGIEKNSLDDWLMQPLQLKMLQRGQAIDVKALQAPQDRSKEQFIMGLLPFANAKDIVLIGGKMMHPQLVAEWINFPQGPRDIMNALAYSLRMFSGVPVYEDFSGANIGESPVPRRGETLYAAFSGSQSESVCVAMVRDGRRIQVAADFSAAGAPVDAIKTVVFALRSTFPQASIQPWLPAEIYDQAQRVGVLAALRAERLTPMRGEHVAVARGCLSERIRGTWHNKRMFLVDDRARLTLNAISAGYARAVERGGRVANEPEAGISRLAAEALECMVAMLDRIGEQAGGFPVGAHIDTTPAGAKYVTANPRARA